jgi:hypothetical protein
MSKKKKSTAAKAKATTKKSALLEQYKGVSEIIEDINNQKFDSATEKLEQFSGYIKGVANHKVILKYDMDKDDNLSNFELFASKTFQSTFVDKAVLDDKGAVIRAIDNKPLNKAVLDNKGKVKRVINNKPLNKAVLDNKEKVDPAIDNKQPSIVHEKTNLFSALLMIQGAEVIAKKMMDLDQTGLFNETGALGVPPLCLVMDPRKSDACKAIARELVDRGGFKLDDTNLDTEKEEVSILDYLAMKKSNYLLSYMIEKGEAVYNFNKEYNTSIVSYLKSITPLMYFTKMGNFEAVKMLVESAGVNVNHKANLVNTTPVNALSLVANNMEIAEYLINKGSKFLGISVGSNLSDMTKSSKKIADLIAARAYYEEATKLIHNAGDSDEEKATTLTTIDNLAKGRKAKQDSAPEKSASSITLVEEDKSEENDNFDSLLLDFDTMLLKYFITKDEELAGKIRELCLGDPELALSLVTTLNSQYLENADVNKLVGNLLCDPTLIQKYFEDRKSLIKAKMVAVDVRKEEQKSGWKLNDGTKVSFDEAIPVKTTMDCNIYIKIADDMSQYVGTNGLSNLVILSQDSKGTNGVKFRKDLKIATLKTKALGNDRLVAEGIYKDEFGNMLLHFKHICNHTKVENWSKSSSDHKNIEIIPFGIEKFAEETDIAGKLGDTFEDMGQ